MASPVTVQHNNKNSHHINKSLYSITNQNGFNTLKACSIHHYTTDVKSKYHSCKDHFKSSAKTPQRVNQTYSIFTLIGLFALISLRNTSCGFFFLSSIPVFNQLSMHGNGSNSLCTVTEYLLARNNNRGDTCKQDLP